MDTGAVIVKNKQILATGYNGAPSNTIHCLDIGCIRIK
ncbi:MAG: cytidine deaminase, partial [Desulfoplanes sp.]|nr:cytidine deaminase [Desulfoplanes sp.]